VSVADVRRENPKLRVVVGAGSKRAAIAEFYRAVEAPAWAAPNLDGLADVLGDLSWLPPARSPWPGSIETRCRTSHAARSPGSSKN
jgi:hypothetical protein